MFMFRKNRAETAGEGLADAVAIDAEGFYRSGAMHCAEAVLAAIRKHFVPDAPEEVISLASGFGGGSGAGCICGAVSGGTIALGLAVKGDRKHVSQLTRELHKWFKHEYGATCCKVVSAKGRGECPILTGRVAGKIAEMLKG